MPSATFGQRVQLVFSIIRISCFKCWQRIRCHHPEFEVKDSFEILCLGLSQAGKSSVLSALVGEDVNDSEPTTGFNIKNLLLQDINVNLKELGGGDSVRPFWNRYFNGVDGLIYVINGSAEEQLLASSCQELKTVLNAHASMNSLPCLVLFTHQDSSNIRDSKQLMEILKKAGLTNKNKKHWIMHLCSVHEPETVKEGLDLLLKLIKLCNRKRIATDESFLSE
ncbi:ADP-ribosylation factor-like protein 15 [Nymphon striatum]|nr:ADP-ribosylation factor-like protein 15 [Nymphon striatum]